MGNRCIVFDRSMLMELPEELLPAANMDLDYVESFIQTTIT